MAKITSLSLTSSVLLMAKDYILSIVRKQLQNFFIFRSPAGRFNDHDNCINVGQAALNRLIHSVEKFGRMLGLKSRRVSTKMYWASSVVRTPIILSLVVTRFLACNADNFSPTRALIKVLFADIWASDYCVTYPLRRVFNFSVIA